MTMPPSHVVDYLDDIEIESIRCDFCRVDLTSFALSQREVHYEDHLNEFEDRNVSEGSRALPIDLETIPESPNSRTARSGPTNQKHSPKRKKLQLGLVKEIDLFWYPARGSPPPHSYVPGLIPVLRKSLLACHNSGQLRRAALCMDKAVHIHREAWDAGWGCGYRNFLMACAALMSQTQQPMYFPLLDFPLPPSIRNLQTWIEDAWNEGFDAEGKKQLENLIGTSKWIGTGDLWVAFVSRRIPAQLVDFDFRNKAGGSEKLINWVVEYFTPKGSQQVTNVNDLNKSPIVNTTKMPLILQHDGHSRTVVGYEVDQKGVTNLLVFDPAHRPADEISKSSEKLRLASVPQASGSSKPLQEQPSNVIDLTASTSTLKRKRSIIASPQNTKQPRMDQTIQAKHNSPAHGLKNSLSKMGLGHKEKELAPLVIIKKFRLEVKNLEKKKQYQILYFPMTAPLTDRERLQRKSVTSISVT